MSNNFTKLFLLVCLFFHAYQGQAQNYIINPATDGGFEGDHGWILVNSAGQNKWVIGSAEKTSGSSGAFISSDPSTPTITSPQSINSVIYLYKDVIVPENATSISVSFKFKNPTATNTPPRVFFVKTSDFPGTPQTNLKYSDFSTLTKVLANESNWVEYTNSSPLVNDRVATFTSKTLIPGESYRIIFDWSALRQDSYTQTSPVTRYPKGARIVSENEFYTPGTASRHTIVFDEDGQNYGIEWSISGGSEIQSGQNTTSIMAFAPLGTTGIQYYSARFTAPTPTFQFNGVNSGLIAIDEVSLTYTATPKITSISANQAAVGSNITITGEFFDPVSTNNVVFLGGVKCPVVSGSDSQLVVTIPAHAYPAYFTVTNKTTNLIAVSSKKFSPLNVALAGASYSPSSFGNVSFETPISFATGFPSSFDQKFTLVDVDLDGKLDVVSYGTNGVPRFLKSNAQAGVINSATFAAVTTFSGVTPTYTPSSSRSVLFSDFNNDGKLDFGLSNNVNNGGFVSPNTSDGGVGAIGQSISLLSSGNKYPITGAFLPIDINEDGRIDVFGLSTGSGNVKTYYSKNNSVNNSFGFTTGNTNNDQDFNQSFNLSSAYGGDYGDFDGDGLKDVVYGADNTLVLVENTTRMGTPDVRNFGFSQKVFLPIPTGKAQVVKFFDLDGDGLLDIVSTNQGTNKVSVFRNTGSGFEVGERIDFTATGLTNTIGLGIADMNGDGKPDLVVNDFVNGVNSSRFAYFENESTSGTISFKSSVLIITASDAYHQVELVDIDGDNKPDIVAANVTDQTLDVFRNRIFESGSISGSVTICIGASSPTISALSAGSVSSGTPIYSWQKSTTSSTSGYALIAGESGENLSPESPTQTSYYRRGIASSDTPAVVFYSLPVTITVDPLPTITKSATVTICGIGSVPLVAETSAGENSIIKWYDAETGGNLVGQSNSGEIFKTPELTESTTYYAEAVNANGCISASRVAVLADLNLAIPVATVGIFVNTKCNASSFTLIASTSSEATIKWYDAETGGTPLKEGNSFTTPVLSENTTYYVEASNCNGASVRTAVTVTVIETPSITSAPGVTICQFSNVTLTATASAGTLNWYDVPTGGTPNIALATINNISVTTTRYVSTSITVNGVTCESARTAVTATMLAAPAITNAIANPIVYGATTSALWVTVPGGSSVSWYADAAGTQLLLANNGNFTTPTIRSTTSFYAIATSTTTGCKSAPREITVTYSGPLFDGLANTFALTNQENVNIKATGLSRLSTSTDWVWQRSDNGGITWTNLTASLDGGVTYSGFSGRGGTSSTLVISKADPRLHGFQYRLRLIGTSSGHAIETNPSILTIADVYGECEEGDLAVTDFTSSTLKTGLTTLSGAEFVNDETKLSDGNTQTGMVVLNSQTLNVTSSLSFDGVDDQVFIGQPASIQALTSALTVEAWVYPRSFGNDWFKSPIVEKNGQFGLRIGSKIIENCYPGGPPDYWYCYDETVGGVVAFTVANGSKNESIITNENTIAANTWSHLAATYNGQTLILYVNGVKVGERINSQFTTTGSGDNLILGGSGFSDRDFNGIMDEVRVWNTVKSQEEIQASMNSNVTGSAGLAVYYKFMEGAGTQLNDLSGNGANGTLNNFSFSGNSNWSTSAPSTLASDVKKLASITADLGTSATINGVKLAGFSGLKDGSTTVTPNFNGGYMESSLDGTTWTRQISTLPNLQVNGDRLALNSVTARYLRVTKEDQGSNTYFGLSEMTILGGGYETVPYFRDALPTEQYVLTGTELTLAAVANAIQGQTISSYQWSSSSSPVSDSFVNLVDGATVVGANTSSLTISNYTNGTPTYYRLTATQSNGCVVSTQVLVNLETEPYYPITAGTSTLQTLNSWTVIQDGTVGSTPTAFQANKYFVLRNSTGGTYEIGADWTNAGTLRLNGNSLSLTSTFIANLTNIEGFSSTAYVKTSGTSYLRSLVSNSPKVFPVGTSTSYSPVTITNNLGTDELFSVSVADGVTNPGTGITDYLKKTWRIVKQTNTSSGGTNLDVTFQWDANDVEGSLPEPMVFWGSSAAANPWSALTIGTNFSSIERGTNFITLKGFKGILGTSARFFMIRNSAPAITSFAPSSAGIGKQVIITGTGFTGTSAVLFNAVAATSFTVDSPTQITATIASGTTTGRISVTTPGGTVQSGNNLTIIALPTITSFTPVKTQEGQPITITGTNFTDVSEVKIGGVLAQVLSVSSTQIIVLVPQGATSGNVEVTAAGGIVSTSGFVLGVPLVSAAKIISWYPSLTTSGTWPSVSATKNAAIVNDGLLSVSGLNALANYSTTSGITQMNWTIPAALPSTLDIAAAPYISTSFDNVNGIKFERFVIQGLNVTGTTKLQLRWSVDNFASSLGEFTPRRLNTWETTSAFSTSNYRFTSVNLSSLPMVSSGQNIEFRIYAYDNSSTNQRISFVRRSTNNILTDDNTSFSLTDSDDAISIFGSYKPDPGLAQINNIVARLTDRQVRFDTPVSNTNGAISVSTPANNGVADYANNVISFKAVGTTSITVTQAETEDYATVSRTASITVRDFPLIQMSNVESKVNDPEVTLLANSPSLGAITYQSSNPTVGSITGNKLTALAKGVSQLTASQVASGSYLAATANSVLLVKDPQKPEPTLSWIGMLNKTLDDQTVTLPRPQTNSTGIFTYYSSNPQVATISDRTVTLVGNGITILTAVQSETDTHNLGKVVTLLVVGDSYKLSADLGELSAYTKLVTDPDFTITAPTTSSSATINYVIADEQVASVIGDTVTLMSSGVSKIYAFQQETTTHKAAAVESLLTVNLPPVPNISYPSELVSAQKGTAITQVSPLSSGGVVTNYSVWPPLPEGLTLNSSTGEISGTPTFETERRTYKITGSNEGGEFQSDFTLVVLDLAPAGLSFTGPQTYVKNVTITSLFPTVSGGKVTSFTITPSLPSGLNLNPTTGEISGTSTVKSDQTTYTIVALNSGGETTTTLDITVSDEAPSSLIYNTPNVLSKNKSIAPISPNVEGGVISNFTLPSGSLPTGLTLDATTGVISGAPTGIFDLTDFTIRGSNSSGFAETIVQFISNDSEPNISYPTPTVVTKGEAMTAISPISQGGAVTSYRALDELPAGLSLNTQTGEISGIPSILSVAQFYTILATNFAGTDEFELELSVVDVPPSVVAYSASDFLFELDQTVNIAAPTSEGGVVISYAISPNLPDGLTFNTETGTITGTPTSYSAKTEYTITATNSGGSSTVKLDLAIDKKSNAIVALSDLTRTFGDGTIAIEPTSDGTGVYSLVIADETVAEATGTTITIIGAGTTNVTVNQAETTTHKSASTSFELVINKRAADLLIQDTTKNYAGNETFTIQFNSNGTGSISYVVADPSIASITGNELTVLKSGSTLITATQNGDNNHFGDIENFTLTVNKVELVVTPDENQSKVFGQADPTLTYTSAGAVLNETPFFTGGLTREAGDSVGVYAIEQGSLLLGDNGSFLSENYTLSFTAGKEFSILRKDIGTSDLVISSIQDFDYNGLDQEPLPEIYEGCLPLIKDLDYTVSYSNNLNVGTATVQLTGIGNYSGTNSKTFEIKKAPLRVEVDVQSKVYGNSDPVFTVQYIGLLNNETETVLGGLLNLEREQGENIGSYIISASGYTSDNYAITYAPNNLTITQKDVSDQDILVDEILDLEYKASAYQVEPLIKQGSVDMLKDTDYSLEYMDNLLPGTATLTIRGLGNYTGVKTKEFKILKKSIQVLIDKQSKDFGAIDSVLVYQIDPSLFGTDVLSGSLERQSGEDVGLYDILLGTLDAGANYELVIQGDDKFEIVSVDTDGDGVPDHIEIQDSTDPADKSDFKDSDEDGVPDYVEVVNGTDPADKSDFKDSDEDGVPDYVEVVDGTDPTDKSDFKDSDGDGVPDYVEAETDGTDPTDKSDFKDSDGDGVPDYVEVVEGTDPADKSDFKDSDGDNVPDYVEEVDGTDPADKSDFKDSDGDGVPDYVEVETDGTDPADKSDFKDSDGDNVPDYVEVVDGTDPADKSDFKDSDGDGVPDYVEVVDGTDPADKSDFKDSDGDGVPDYVEVVNGTEPADKSDFKDSDGDGVPDYVEVETDATDPADKSDFKDSDGDGVPDYVEVVDGTDPADKSDFKDSDGDGVPDYEEERDETSPLLESKSGFGKNPVTNQFEQSISMLEEEQDVETISADESVDWSLKKAGANDDTNLFDLVLNPNGSVSVRFKSPSLPGTYDISLCAKDSAGNQTCIMLTIKVNAKPIVLNLVIDNNTEQELVKDPTTNLAFIDKVIPEGEQRVASFTTDNNLVWKLEPFGGRDDSDLFELIFENENGSSSDGRILSQLRTSDSFVKRVSVLFKDRSIAGVYQVKLSAKDQYGNESFVVIKVTVLADILAVLTIENEVIIAWGSQDLIKAQQQVLTSDGESPFVAVQLDETPLNRFARGDYRLTGELVLPSYLKNPFVLKADIVVRVLPKPAPQDLTLSESVFAADFEKYFIFIGNFEVMDPMDDIHELQLLGPGYDNKYFEIKGKQLFWSTADAGAGRTSFTILVRVTDRDGNTFDKFFEITRTRSSISGLEVFNMFTPNGDGVNDDWGIPGIRFYRGAKIQVFDGGGILMFYTEDAKIRWDGTHKGKELPVGAYYWILQVDETSETRRGIVNLLRK